MVLNIRFPQIFTDFLGYYLRFTGSGKYLFLLLFLDCEGLLENVKARFT